MPSPFATDPVRAQQMLTAQKWAAVTAASAPHDEVIEPGNSRV